MYNITFRSYVDGGLIASLTDCHTTDTIAAAAYRASGREMGSEPALRFVTASLHVDDVQPNPLGMPLEVRGRVSEIKGRKVVVRATVSAEGEFCAQGEIMAVQMPQRISPAKMTAGRPR